MTDTWHGERLPTRRAVSSPDMHIRIYLPTGELVSFATSNSLDAICQVAIRVQAEHPGKRLLIVPVDGPAY